MVASSWDDLTDKSILAPIEVSETGYRPRADPGNHLGHNGEIGVWTGTDTNGGPLTSWDFCSNWTTANVGTATWGHMIHAQSTPWVHAGSWTTSGGSVSCDVPPNHLYCFEQ
jgi:hypothetical protein